MKRIVFATLLLAAVSVATLMGITSNYTEKKALSGLALENIEALSACEIVNDKKVTKFKCVGEDGTCEAKKYSHTITCTGEKVIDEY